MSLILNDTHIGAVRQAGATPVTQELLKDYLRHSFADFIESSGEDHLIINGDMLDAFTVETSEVIKLYEILSDWLFGVETRTLALCMGNHDHNPRGAKVSSFHLLCHFLKSHFEDRVTVFDTGFAHIKDNIYVIPHCPNQSLFEIEVAKATKVDGKDKFLLLHCNLKNTFAEHSDQSLNLTDELLAPLMVAGWTLVLAHEHIGYELRGGRIKVVGNQWPSSIADCLGNDKKNALIIDGNTTRYVTTWKAEGSFLRLDWQDIGTYEGKHKFIRVEGDALAEQAADVVSAISKFRQRSQALVITNAVKVEGVSGIADMTMDTIEAIKGFDVLNAILSRLDEKEQEVVKELLK